MKRLKQLPFVFTDEVRPPYTTLVVDPPWPYNDRLMSGARRTRGAANHYPVMSLPRLRELRPQDLATPAAHLYLWTTNAFLGEALDLMRAWEFAHKTMLTWVKPQIGMGHYFRNNTEHVLFGVRGRLPTMCRDQPTAFTAPRTRHSAKPDAFYAIVERMSPEPYLELFARRPRDGWCAIGNEIDGQPIHRALRGLEASFGGGDGARGAQ